RRPRRVARAEREQHTGGENRQRATSIEPTHPRILWPRSERPRGSRYPPPSRTSWRAGNEGCHSVRRVRVRGGSSCRMAANTSNSHLLPTAREHWDVASALLAKASKLQGGL